MHADELDLAPALQSSASRALAVPPGAAVASQSEAWTVLIPEPASASVLFTNKSNAPSLEPALVPPSQSSNLHTSTHLPSAAFPAQYDPTRAPYPESSTVAVSLATVPSGPTPKPAQAPASLGLLGGGITEPSASRMAPLGLLNVGSNAAAPLQPVVTSKPFIHPAAAPLEDHHALIYATQGPYSEPAQSARVQQPDYAPSSRSTMATMPSRNAGLTSLPSPMLGLQMVSMSPLAISPLVDSMHDYSKSAGRSPATSMLQPGKRPFLMCCCNA